MVATALREGRRMMTHHVVGQLAIRAERLVAPLQELGTHWTQIPSLAFDTPSQLDMQILQVGVRQQVTFGRLQRVVDLSGSETKESAEVRAADGPGSSGDGHERLPGPRIGLHLVAEQGKLTVEVDSNVGWRVDAQVPEDVFAPVCHFDGNRSHVQSVAARDPAQLGRESSIETPSREDLRDLGDVQRT